MKFFIFLIALFMTSITFATDFKKFEIESYELANGLRVILHKKDNVPLYSLHLWYDVGSKDEEKDKTGLAHFFEHLMFKGTKKFPEGEYDKVISQLGGVNNAFTTKDYTGYFVDMPIGTLDKVLELEADRMVNLELNEDKINVEREVVKEERRMRVENSPYGMLFETLNKTAYASGSYKWPVIGSMEHLQNAKLQDFEKFYKKYYAPNNAILVISGKININKTKRLINKYFNKIPRSQIIRSSEIKNIKFVDKKQIKKLKFPTDTKMLGLAFHGVSVHNQDKYALDLIMGAMTSGGNSVLTEELVLKNKVFSSIAGTSSNDSESGLILFLGSILNNVSFKTAKKKLLDSILTSPLSKERIENYRKKLLINTYSQLQTNSDIAYLLANNMIYFNDPNYFIKGLENYKKLTFNEIENVYKKYFKNQNLTIVEVSK